MSNLIQLIVANDIEGVQKVLDEVKKEFIRYNTQAVIGFTADRFSLLPRDLQVEILNFANNSVAEHIDSLFPEPALIVAVGNENLEITRVLLEAGANPNIKMETPNWSPSERVRPRFLTPLVVWIDRQMITPVQHRSNDMGALLIEYGADRTVIFRGGFPLISAVVNDDIDMVDTLFDLGADPNVGSDEIDGEGGAIFFANTPDMIDLLVEHGADVNRIDATGQTPLMIASMRNELEVVEALLFAGADPNIRDNRGRSALMFAELTGNEGVVNMLVEAGAE